MMAVAAHREYLEPHHAPAADSDAAATMAQDDRPEPVKSKVWNHLGWQDYAMGAGLTWLVTCIWEYTLRNL
jgi:hypothetical protein